LTRSDNLQLRILREIASPSTFGSKLRPTYSDIAKKLGVDEETARVRVRRAQQSGSVLGWQLALNPHLLGREATNVMLEVDDPSSKDSVISRIELVDEVVMIMDFYEKPIRVVFYHENDRDRERRLSLIQSTCGDKNPITWQDVFAPCDVKLKRTDWQILKALRTDSMQSNADIANELRVSARTVKRRLSFMTGSKAIYSFARGDVKKMPGMAYFFLVDCANGGKKDQVDEKITSRLENAVYIETGNKQYSTFTVVFQNPAEADETYRWMKSLDGADDVKMSMMREIVSVPDWLDKEIEKHLRKDS